MYTTNFQTKKKKKKNNSTLLHFPPVMTTSLLAFALPPSRLISLPLSRLTPPFPPAHRLATTADPQQVSPASPREAGGEGVYYLLSFMAFDIRLMLT